MASPYLRFPLSRVSVYRNPNRKHNDKSLLPRVLRLCFSFLQSKTRAKAHFCCSNPTPPSVLSRLVLSYDQGRVTEKGVCHEYSTSPEG